MEGWGGGDPGHDVDGRDSPRPLFEALIRRLGLWRARTASISSLPKGDLCALNRLHRPGRSVATGPFQLITDEFKLIYMTGWILSVPHLYIVK
jgi:hypothetical protein